MIFLDETEEIKQDKTQSDASSETKVDNTPEPATEDVQEKPVEPVQTVEKEEPLYSKQALVDYGSFSVVDRAILQMVVSDTEKITQEEAQAKINQFKGVKE